MQNRVALVLDRSGSMSGLWEQAKKEAVAIMESLRRNANQTGQETLATIVCFSNTSEVALYKADVRNELGPINLGHAGGGTALLDALGAAADTIRAWEPKNDPETSYLAIGFTDGEENQSTRFPSGARFQKYVAGLGENWTFTLQVPQKHRPRAVHLTGFAEENIREWEQTTAGLAQASAATQAGIGGYFAARAAGAARVDRFYHVAVATTNLSQGTIDRNLYDVSSRYNVLPVPPSQNGAEVRPFVTMHGMPFVIGGVYYQLTKSEEVQPQKQLLVRDQSTGRIFGGPQARTLLGLPTDGSKAKVTPAMMMRYQVFVQSTSVNRKLVGGTVVLVDRLKATDDKPTWDHTVVR
jgi:hypothetical protein